MIFQRGFALLVVAALLGACGREQPRPAPNSAKGGAPTVAPTARPTAMPTTRPTVTDESRNTALANNKGMEISLTIGGGGPHAGTYAFTSPEALCAGGVAANERDSAWNTKYASATSDPVEFSGLDVFAVFEEGTTTAAISFITISFGELKSASETQYELKMLGNDIGFGSGTVTIDNQGQTATILINAETADGTPVEARLECLSVLRIR